MPLPVSAPEYLALAADQRADVLLDALATCSAGQRGKNLLRSTEQRWYPGLNQIGPLPANVPATQAERKAASEALEDAYASLMSSGDIRQDTSAGTTFCALTGQGKARRQVSLLPDAGRVAFAIRVLQPISLHPALESRDVHAHFRQGKFETALRDGSAYLEDAIRTLSGLSAREVGARLCGKALSSAGPLADPNLPPGQRDGWQQLYTAYFGVVRNLVAHRDFKYESNKEAFSNLLLLDQLVEYLGTTAARLGQAMP